MFKHLYLGELKKMFSLKTAIIFFAIFVFGFIIVGVSFSTLRTYVVESTQSIESESPIELEQAFKLNTTKQQAEDLLAQSRAKLESLKEEKSKMGYKYYISFISSSDDIYMVKSQIALYEHILDNQLYDTDVYLYDGNMFALDAILGQSATGFAYTMLSMFTFLLTIYALVIGSGAYSTEMRNGTLKILLLKPITRNRLTFAKLLSVLTLVAAAVTTVFLCITAYSYIAFDDPSYKLLFVFNASSVFQAGYAFPLFLGALSLMVSALAYGIMAFFFGTIIKRRVWGFVLPLAIDMAAPLVGLAGLSRFWISNIINFSGFFGVSSSLAVGSNFFISLPLFVLMFGAMIVLSFFAVDKRDIA